ncbi:hypothetical protein [Emcibacter sp. SYSU 3D8]|uniref:hypothetical protein n=1 Tax=Emcibacter sp. SYSU 3D8 TaxID=3133969 RepID=UPI0031FF1317
MAEKQITTITPASISPIFDRFRAAILPHIPEGLEIDFDQTIEEVYHEHVVSVDWQSISAAEAYVTVHTLRALQSCEALSKVEEVIAGLVMGTMYDVLRSDHPKMLHTKADAMARLDWVIEELESGDGPSTNDIDALKRARWAFSRLINSGAVVDDRPVRKAWGPTVGEVDAVEKAFAKHGLSVDQAHEAVGCTPHKASGE